MKKILALGLGGLLFLSVTTPVSATILGDEVRARAEKVGVCHWSADEEQFVFVRVAKKQLDRGKGHANHEEDRFDLSREECLALND